MTTLRPLILSAALLSISVVQASVTGLELGANLTDFVGLQRGRSLIFQNSGTLKFSIGPSVPVRLGDPITWRSLVSSYTLQGGHYPLPTEPIYAWDRWEEIFARSMHKAEKYLVDMGHKWQPDNSRLFVYVALEKFMNTKDANQGRACLLRAICENAQVDHHVGMLGEIVNVLLAPGREKLDPVYEEAYVAGKSGVDCLKLYAECPAGTNILDRFFSYW